MKLASPFLLETLGLLGSALIRAWMGTMDYKVAYYDPNVDPAYANDGKHRIYIFWHENILVPLFLRRNCNLTMLLSQHGDAEVLSRVANLFGFHCVRGSSYRGAGKALAEMKRYAEQTNLTVTPDGPRGPRRVLAPGAVYLASKLQIPLVLLGIGCDRPWRANSWDKFAVPRPYSRVRVVTSGDIVVPPDAKKELLLHYQQKVQQLLTDLSDAAEHWAESGDFMLNQSQVQAGPKHSIFYRANG
ncbi:MAG: lysophospholipid acyltransferase family protein [Planctomycetaceae bacterium]|nr:lysophospholipid acyltransferase family protein [Planctomycetaceae bacterium]